MFRQEVCGATESEVAVGAVAGSFNFEIPHCVEHANMEPRYEIQYIRDHIVLGRMMAANESVVPGDGYGNNNNEKYFDILGLEHLLVFFTVVAVFTFIVTYYVRSRKQQSEAYAGLSCFSAHDYDKEVMLNEDTAGSSYHL